MNLTRLALRRPITIVMLLSFVVLAGLISFPRIPVRRLPNVNYPFLRIVIGDPGQSATTIAKTVTQRVESALSNQSGLVTMTGTSAPGRSVVALQFAGGTNIDQKASSVSLALDKLTRALPTTATPPAIIKANPNALPIMNIALSGPLAPSQLYTLATTTVAPALQETQGVAQVVVVGGEAPVVNVQFHTAALSAYGVSLNQALTAMRSQNAAVSGGIVRVGSQALASKTQGGYRSVSSLADLPIANKSGSAVLLKDVATVSQGLSKPQSYSKLNGHRAVGMVVTASSTANTLAVAQAISTRLKALDASFPPGVHAAITGNITTYTKHALSNVEFDLALGVLAAGLVLLFFLHRFTNTAIVMLAIPISLIGTFSFMYFMGFSLDLISLLALSLVIGILVDDSIVVLENIHRHRSMGKAPEQAAYDGRMEIGAAAVAITLTDVVIYAPVAFVSGNVAQLFREFGLTIVAATLLSLLVSYTLTPMLSARWAKSEKPESQAKGRFAGFVDGVFSRLQQRYRRVIAWALDHRLMVGALAVMAALLSYGIVASGVLPTTFVPREDNGVFTVNLSLPPGTPLSSSTKTFQAVAHTIQKWPGVRQVFLSSGYGAGKGASTDVGQLTVDLISRSQRPSIYTYVKRTHLLTKHYAGLTARGHVQNPLVLGGARAVTIDLLGPNISTLEALATKIQTAVSQNPAVSQVSTSIPQPTPQLTVALNRDAAAYYGVSTQAVGQTVAGALGSLTAPPLIPSSTQPSIPVRAYVGANGTPTLTELQAIPVAAAHGPVPLGAVAKLKEQPGSRVLTQINREYAISVSASSASGNIGPATQVLLAAVKHVSLPTGYTSQIGGAAKQQARDFGPLLLALGLSIVFIYMLLAALYESFADPLSVLLSIPLATVGALAGLWLTGLAISIFALIAMIMLVGVVAKNAILLIDYTKTLRSSGMERSEALLTAGATRMRPILMTTATLIGSMLPLALVHGSGASERMPIAVVLIGGLTSSTLLTLLVVPVLYSYIDDVAGFLRRFGRSVAAPASSSMPGD